ncbi:hypothetical protein ACWEQG_28705 [Microbispora sp. NPDC004025]
MSPAKDADTAPIYAGPAESIRSKGRIPDLHEHRFAPALAELRTGVRLEPGHLRPGGLPHRASIAHYYESPEGTSPRLARRVRE